MLIVFIYINSCSNDSYYTVSTLPNKEYFSSPRCVLEQIILLSDFKYHILIFEKYTRVLAIKDEKQVRNWGLKKKEALLLSLFLPACKPQ
jgi:predicted GIY-YIG superfamily endonuclease